MEFSKEYLAEQKKCIIENLGGYKNLKRDVITYTRLKILKDFCSPFKNGLSVGSGAHEPIYLNLKNACDIDAISYELLKEQGWKGAFFVCSCDNIGMPAKFYDLAVCSEVIEHLPTIELVQKTFLEVDRISKNWIFTTPNVDKCSKENQYPGHLQFWNVEDLKKIIPPELLSQVEISTLGLFIYIKKHDRKILNK